MSSSSDELIFKFISECENKQTYKQKPNKKMLRGSKKPRGKGFLCLLFSQV